MPVAGAAATVQDSTPIRISGRVLLGADSVPTAGVEVSLHEIRPDGGGAVARDTTGSGGVFRFSHVAEGDPATVVYLVTARYESVPYVGRALHSLAEPVEGYVLTVHPTRPADDVSLSARRTLVAPAEGGLEVIEILGLPNPSDSTLVPAGETALGWELRLPPAATGVEPLAVSLTETGSGVRGMGSTLLVSGGIRPGGREVAVRYRVPGTEFSVPVRGPETRHEVLLHPSLEGSVTGLTPGEAVPFEGVSYRRWVGAGLEPGASIRVTARGRSLLGGSWLPWLFVGMGILALAGAFWSWRRGSPAA